MAKDAVPEFIANYKIISQVGKGGMGAVYRAVHQTLGREVALKLLPAEFTQSAEYVARFLREARAVANLNHLNVVTVHDAGEQMGQYFIAMEMVNGGSLGGICKRYGILPERVALDFLGQAANGLGAAHRLGLIHRDIKPENMLVSFEGILKIVDFGLVLESSRESHLTRTGTFLGTPTYMSPEQCDGDVADGRSDLYSLGATFFNVLTGQPPFTAPTALGILYKHKFEEPPDMKKLNPDLSDATRDIIKKLLFKKREERYLDCKELIKDVERAMEKARPKPEDWDLDALLESIKIKEAVPTLVPSLRDSGNIPTLGPQTLGSTPGTQPPTFGPTSIPGGTAPTLMQGPGVMQTQHHPGNTQFQPNQTANGSMPTLVTPANVHGTPATTPVQGQETPTGAARQFQGPQPLFTPAKLGIAAGIAVVIGVAGYFAYVSVQQQKLEGFIANATSARDQKDFTEALFQLRLGLEQFPESEALRKLQADVNIQRENFKKVQTAALKKEIRREEKFGEKMEAAKQLRSNGKLVEAIAAYAEAMKLEEDGETARIEWEKTQYECAFSAGKRDMEARNYANAIKQFKEAQKWEPEGGVVTGLLEKAQLAQGEQEIEELVKQKNWREVVSKAVRLQVFGFPKERIREFEMRQELEDWRKRAGEEKTKDFKQAVGHLGRAAEIADKLGEHELRDSLTKESKDILFDGYVAQADAEGKNWTKVLTHLGNALKEKDDAQVRQRHVDVTKLVQTSYKLNDVLEAAEGLITGKQWVEAVEQLETALAIRPEDPKIQGLFNKAKGNALLNSGEKEWASKNFRRAEEFFEEAARFVKDDADLKRLLDKNQSGLKEERDAIAGLETNAAAAKENGQYQDAIKLYTDLKTRHPSKAVDYDRALVDVQKAIAFQGLFNDGSAALKSGRWDDAEKSLENAKENAKDKKDIDALVEQLGSVRKGRQASFHLEEGKGLSAKLSHGQAEKAFEKALQLLPATSEDLRKAVESELQKTQAIIKEIAGLEATATQLEGSGKWDQAISNYKDLQIKNPARKTHYRSRIDQLEENQKKQVALQQELPNLKAKIKNYVASGDVTSARTAADEGIKKFGGDSELGRMVQSLAKMSDGQGHIVNGQKQIQNAVNQYARDLSAEDRARLELAGRNLANQLSDSRSAFGRSDFEEAAKSAEKISGNVKTIYEGAVKEAQESATKKNEKKPPFDSVGEDPQDVKKEQSKPPKQQKPSRRIQVGEEEVE